MHASASSGTQAGLVFGNAAQGYDIDIMGINVFHPEPGTLKQRISSLLATMQQRFGVVQSIKKLPIHINHAYFGGAYGQPTAAGLEAINMFASLEGILLDPVYSGKAAAGLIDQITLGNFEDHEHVVFVHTGGAASLSAYDSAW